MQMFHNLTKKHGKSMKSQRNCNSLFSRSMLNTKLLRCSIFLGILSFVISCSKSGQPTGPQSLKSDQTRILRRGNPGEPHTLDPALADDEFSFPIIRDMFEGLTSESARGETRPGIAESWTVDTSGTIYTFKIRPNARWSDGDRVTAQEFVAGMRRVVDPKTGSGSGTLLSSIKNASNIISGRVDPTMLGVTALGDDVLELILQHPAPFILQILAQPVGAPLHIHKRSKNQTVPDLQLPKVSDGPYKLSQWIPGAFIDLRRDPMYWNSAQVKVESIRYVFEASESTELKQYIAGELEITSSIPMPDFERVQLTIPSEIQITPILGTLFLALDLSEPPFNLRKELRQALSMTIEREQLVKLVVKGVSPAYGFVANGIKSYTQQRYDWAALSRDERIGAARDLYKLSGYSPSKPLRIKLFFNSNEGIRRLMIAIAGGWKESLGIETELVSTEFRVFLEERKNRSNWDAIRLGWYADYDDPASFLNVFDSTNIQNDAGYNSQVFDRLLESASNEPQVEFRRAILEKAEKTLLEDYPIIPIYFYSARRLVKPYIGGATVTPMNRSYSKDLYWKRSD